MQYRRRRRQRGGEVPIKFNQPEISETSASSAIKGSIQAQKENNANLSEMNKQVGGGDVTVPQFDQAGDSGNKSISNGIANILKGSADSEYDSKIETGSSPNSDYIGGRRKTRRKRKLNKRSLKRRKLNKRSRKTRKRKLNKRSRKTRKLNKRSRKGAGLFTKKNKIMINGMSEGTIKRLSNSDTSFAAIVKARSYIKSEMDPLKAHHKAFNNNSLKRKDLLALPKYLEWKKTQNVLPQI